MRARLSAGYLVALAAACAFLQLAAAAARAPASFEIIGLHGAAYPGILRAENADGMSLVNHTWTHTDLAPLPAWRWPAEVDRTSTLLRGVTGHPVRCLRPPYGLSDRAVDAQLRGAAWPSSTGTSTRRTIYGRVPW